MSDFIVKSPVKSMWFKGDVVSPGFTGMLIEPPGENNHQTCIVHSVYRGIVNATHLASMTRKGFGVSFAGVGYPVDVLAKMIELVTA